MRRQREYEEESERVWGTERGFSQRKREQRDKKKKVPEGVEVCERER